MELRVEDLRIDVYRAPGQGAWSSQPDKCVRITHLPSGISVEEYQDRSPHRNRVVAMEKIKPLIEAFDESTLPLNVVKSELEVVKAKLAKAMEALELADSIMGVSRGDAYERECTDVMYDQFNELWDDLSGAKEARERQHAQAEKERLEQIRLAEKKKADKKAAEIQCPQCKKVCQGPQGLLEHSKVKHKVILSVTNFKEILKQQRGGK